MKFDPAAFALTPTNAEGKTVRDVIREARGNTAGFDPAALGSTPSNTKPPPKVETVEACKAARSPFQSTETTVRDVIHAATIESFEKLAADIAAAKD